MSFEVQDLYDVIKIVTLLVLGKNSRIKVYELKSKIEELCGKRMCVESSDINRALMELQNEGLIIVKGEYIELTSVGLKVSEDWKSLLLKSEPVLEIVAGLTDGSVTSLMVILSSFFAKLSSKLTIFTALLTLASVAITNFSSFFLGGVTEDISEIIAIKRLMDYSLNDNPDKVQRLKSIELLKHVFSLLNREVRKINIISAITCSVTTLFAGFMPIVLYLIFPTPYSLIASITFIGVIVILLLVRYRSKMTKVPLKITLIETLIIILAATLASILLGLNL
ncbi:MAG: hypothetical protein N3F64_02095 [Nitrososphaeria archaeon]|nr:hypothetical protein [Nitrososphaeria archaeon]